MADLDKLPMKELTPLLREYGLEVSAFNSKVEMVQALRNAMGTDDDSPNVNNRLPEMYNEFLEKKSRLNRIREEIIKLLESPLFAGQEEFEKLKKRLKDIEKNYKENSCRIVVVGNNSSGKSLFLNYLLGEHILPYTTLPCTSVICEIRKSNEKKFRALGKRNEDTVTIRLDDPNKKPYELLEPFLFLKDEQREQGSKYKLIEIYLPAPILTEGIVLVDSPGLEENEAMTKILDEYIENATAMLCIVDSTQGALTQALRRFLEKVSYEKADPNQKDNAIHRDACLFICNKWDRIDPKQRLDVLKRIKEGAKNSWSDRIDEDKLIPMDSLSAFNAKVNNRRDTKEAKELQAKLIKFMEETFFFKLYSLWKQVDSVVQRVNGVTRMRKNMINKSDLEREQITDKVAQRLLFLKSYVENPANLKSVEALFIQKTKEVNEKLRTFLFSEESMRIFERWAGTQNYSPESYPSAHEKEFKNFLFDVIMEWENQTKHFAACRLICIQEISNHIGSVMQGLKETEDLLEGKPQLQLETRAMPLWGKIAIGLVAPVWVPILLAGAGIAYVIDATQKASKRSKFKENPKAQILVDTKAMLEKIEVEGVTKTLFMSTGTYILKVEEVINAAILHDFLLLKQMKDDESNIELVKKYLEETGPITEELIQLIRRFYVEQLRKNSINTSKLNFGPEIGRGTSGVVFKGAYQGNPVAIKIFASNNTNMFSEFYQEEEALMELKHENILNLIGTATVQRDGEDVFMFVTELADCHLQSYLSKPHPIPERLKLIKQLARAIAFMHKKDFVHRDLKPENILIVSGTLKVADVGLTKKNSQLTGTFVGTPLYMAPEYLGKSYDKMVDVFSFGRIIWEIWFQLPLISVMPRFESGFDLIRESFKVPLKISSKDDPPPYLASLFISCCEKDKNKRPPIEEIVQILESN